jgi:hypothetical protein
MKACFKCKTFKPLSDFYPTPGMRDGHSGKCKECTKADVRANYRTHIDKYKAYERSRAVAPHRVKAREEYAQTEAGKAAAIRAKRRFIERNPLKRKAHILVGNALRSGSMKPMPCEVCGAEKAQAHHDDYSKPLDVRWLCTTHHAEWHKHNTPLCPEQEQAA